MPVHQPKLPWIEAHQPLPSAHEAWPASSSAPGLLAAGADLGPARLLEAYSQGIFPWFSAGQPVLWWSTDPRMVLEAADFRLHRSLRKTLQRFCTDSHCEIRFDSRFGEVMQACAESPRQGQHGTWIQPEMVEAYTALHHAGHAHSVETWMDGQLCGGLYCVAIGKAVFGESMFARRTDASKLALAALVAFCRAHQIGWIDCQQDTRHLASLGGRTLPRPQFFRKLQDAIRQPGPESKFQPLYWNHLLDRCLRPT
jgi:leucyl/phenylalanyl-tRNA---protein transferase